MPISTLDLFELQALVSTIATTSDDARAFAMCGARATKLANLTAEFLPEPSLLTLLATAYAPL